MEISQILPYLNNGTKVYVFDSPKFLKKYLEKYPDGQATLEIKINNVEELIFKDKYKPILRPMSDLVKFIKIDNINIIPIHSLLWLAYGKKEIPKYIKARTKLNFNSLRATCSILNLPTIANEKYEVIKIQYSYLRCRGFIFKSAYFKEKPKIIKEDSILSGGVGNYDSIYLLNKLFEWKFDVFNLIQQGLAIDVNEFDVAVY
jgi:hypothetical protein